MRSADSPSPPFPEFVALIALMIGITAFSIDNLLPAFGPIRAQFRVATPNDAQLLVYVYMIAFGVSQLFYGTIADVVGRRPVLLTGILIFALGGSLAILAPSFEVLLGARAIQGAGTAAARVLAVAIVRDRYEGREMAQVMSLVMMIFLTVPVIAPAVGSGLLLIGGWKAIFISMLGLGALLAIWFGVRMPETLSPKDRVPVSKRRIINALKITVTTRVSLGYATAIGFMMGTLMAYIGSAQQILEESVYALGPTFTLYFGLVAAVQALASLLNARLVLRLGMRRLSHAAICGYLVVSIVHRVCVLYFDGRPPLPLFMTFLACGFFLFGFTVANFNAMAMQPLGVVAGTASSFIGAYTTLIGSQCGLVVARSFSGTVLPLVAGFCVLGALCLFAVLWAEGWRLFVPRQ